VARWDRDNQATSQVAIPLSSIEVRTATAEWLLSVRQFAKDFGLSLTLAVLGFLFTVWEKQRQDRQQAAEKEREVEQRAAEKEKEQVAQTWNMMIPVSHALNTEFYIKIQRAAGLLLKSVQQYDGAKAGSAEALTLKRQAFYCWTLLRRHMRNLTEKSGYYFKDRTGEALANLCGVSAVESFYASGNEAALNRLHRLLKHVALTETLADFLQKLDDKEAEDRTRLFRDCLADFSDWMASASFPRALLSLRGLRAVLEYEVNRPYQYWYGSRERLQVDEATEAHLVHLAQQVETKEPARKGFMGTVKKYLAEGTRQ
jgi:hypothetical protein